MLHVVFAIAFGSSALARIDAEKRNACVAQGGEYDMLQGCIKAKSNKAADTITTWRKAVEANQSALMMFNARGCELRGGQHREPDISGVKGLEVQFEDGVQSRTIPAEMHCAVENSKFAGSDTVCDVGYYAVGANKKVEYRTRKMTYNSSDLSKSPDVKWSDPKGGTAYPIKAVYPIDNQSALDKIEESMAGSKGPACELAIAIDQSGPSLRGAPTPRVDAKDGGSSSSK